MIYLDNGVSVYSGGQYRLDPKRCAPDCVNLISHAHFDHVPSSFKSQSIMCSDITNAIIESRAGIRIDGRLGSHDCVEMLDSGHVPGSSMFLIKGDRRILYTGDFNTVKKYFTEGARPVKADVLIMESTFGREKYVFPPYREIIGSMRDWVEENISRGLHSVFYAYTFGKAQEVTGELSGFNLYATSHVIELNRIISGYGHMFNASPITDSFDGPSVIIAPSGARDNPEIKSILRSGARTASVSGWAMDERHAYSMRVDKAFPLSDHADYSALMEFARAVSPEIVYTMHGSDKELARDIRDKLGIEAIPLKKGHVTLSNFYRND